MMEVTLVLVGLVLSLLIVLAYLTKFCPSFDYVKIVEMAKSRINRRKNNKRSNDANLSGVTVKKSLKGPTCYPLIGSLHKLGTPGGPFEAFTTMAEQYGDIYEIQLGVCKCVVVSSYKLIKEVLILKGSHFGGRPDFLRFHELFGGDRNNSLALCDWSDVQRKRRSIARNFCSPRGGSSQQEELSRVAAAEMDKFFTFLDEPTNVGILKGEQPIKPVILTSMANMFTQYMCSMHFGYTDDNFNRVVRIFDEIFWDINQGYAVDFLPWLKIFYTRHLHRLNNYATDIRSFILKRIIEPRRAGLDLENGEARDFTDALLLHLESPDSELSWQHIIFELEDFLGGHSAIGNLVMLILVNVVTHPEVQRRIHAECDAIFAGDSENYGGISLSHKADMPYTEAAIWETLRVSSSPIVPHVATCDSDIGGYSVAKDTVVFLNNYNINLGESYWGEDCKQFKPERFLKTLESEDGSATTTKVVKPEHFVPFSTGKRTCIGQRLVQGFAFVMITGLLSKYEVSAPANVDVRSKLQPSCVAVPPDCFNLIFTRRSASASETRLR